MNNRRRLISTVVSAVLIAVMAFIGYSVSKTVLPVDPDDGVMRVIFFDVGYADCALFYTNDACILIGSPYGKCDEVAGYLKRADIEKIDYFIVPDYKNENCADSKKITGAFTVENLLLPLPYDGGKGNYLTLKAVNKDSNVTDVYGGMRFKTGGMTVEVLSPTSSPLSAKDGGAVVRISYEDKSVLWCADIDSEQEEKIIDDFPEKLSCDIIKLPSHGSKNACSEDLLGFAGADIAVISCGRNGYGHPSKEVIQRLEEKGMRTYTTQSNGSIVFDISASNIEKTR